MPPCCLPLVNAIKKIKISGGGRRYPHFCLPLVNAIKKSKSQGRGRYPAFVCPWFAPLNKQNLSGGRRYPSNCLPLVITIKKSKYVKQTFWKHYYKKLLSKYQFIHFLRFNIFFSFIKPYLTCWKCPIWLAEIALFDQMKMPYLTIWKFPISTAKNSLLY